MPISLYYHVIPVYILAFIFVNLFLLSSVKDLVGEFVMKFVAYVTYLKLMCMLQKNVIKYLKRPNV